VPNYSLIELSKLADVTPRTIRYYIAQGLLPSPGQLGPSSQYTDEHLELLRLIKKLQSAHMPLADIRKQLRSVSPDQLAAMSDALPAPSGSAVDYIRDVLGTHEVLEEPRTYARRMAFSRSSLPSEVYRPPASMPGPPLPSMPSPASMPAVGKPEPAVAKPEPDRSQWERISLDPDIELHVRHPLTRQNKKAVARLIAIARQLFEED
jgi:DNA-binding transcriptional MerR regulator